MRWMVVLVMLVMTGCRPGDESGAVAVFPYDLTVQVAHQRMTLTWKVNGDATISGYNIYISRTPLAARYPGAELPADIKPFNATVYPGDTNPDDGIIEYEAEGLEDGVIYYVSVRVVFPDRTLSRPSNEVTAVCGPRGVITLGNRYTVQPDGYSFVRDSVVRADDDDNDLYFYSGGDTLNFLASPHRLDGFLRRTRLVRLPFGGTLQEVAARLKDYRPDAFRDRVRISPGDWIYARTAEDYHLLIHVLDLEGAGERRSVRLFFALSPTTGEIFF